MFEIFFSPNRSNESDEQPDRHRVRRHIGDLPENLPDLVLQFDHQPGIEFFFFESDRFPHRRIRQQQTLGQLEQPEQQRNKHLR